MRLSIASSSFGLTPSASIIALTPESDIILVIVGSRFQFKQLGWIAARMASVRFGEETTGLCKRNVRFLHQKPISTQFGPLRRHHANYFGFSLKISKKNRSKSKPWFRARCFRRCVLAPAYGAEFSGHSN